MFAASDPYGESVTLLRAIGLRYYTVVMIRGGLASSILYLLGSEVKIFTAEGFINHVTSSREDLCSGTHTLCLLATGFSHLWLVSFLSHQPYL